MVTTSGESLRNRDREPSEGAVLILDVAKQLFAAKGFDGVSINEIAQQASVSKANVFHHFATKESLYLAVLRIACAETVGSLTEPHSHLDPGEELWQFFSSQLAGLLHNTDSAKLVLREIIESKGERGRLLAQQVLAKFFDRLVNMVAAGQTQGALREDFEPALLAYLMLAANVFFFENHAVTAHLENGQFAREPERYSRDAFRLLLQGARCCPANNDAAG